MSVCTLKSVVSRTSSKPSEKRFQPMFCVFVIFLVMSLSFPVQLKLVRGEGIHSLREAKNVSDAIALLEKKVCRGFYELGGNLLDGMVFFLAGFSFVWCDSRKRFSVGVDEGSRPRNQACGAQHSCSYCC